MPDLLEVGRVDKPHGLRGEVVVSLLTDRTERVAPGAVLHAGDRALRVRAARPHAHRWIVAFEGLASREDAEALHGAALSAEPLPDDGDGLWVHRLIGAEVRTPDGESRGVVESVQANPASDLLVLDSGALVPVVFVTDSSGLPDSLVVDPPEGLFDL